MARRPRRNPIHELQANVRRLGQPPSYTRDLYSWLLVIRWRYLIALFSAFYVVINLLFAQVYMMMGEGIAGAEPGDFGDAFFFSVQTFSTIGYGGMTPKSTFANVVVTVESMVGLLSVAVATGIVFAKFARPSAGVVFTDKMVFNYRNKRPCFMFRVANARGSEIIEASLRLTALMDDVTEEGERMRRLHDLKLMRSVTPILTMSWLVIHEVDESSPLHGMDKEAILRGDVRFIVSMTGIDGTYAQNIHAFYMYYPESVVFGGTFVDVVFPQEDGTFHLDLRRFNDIEVKALPEGTA